MSEERLTRIEDTIKDLSEKVAHLDRSFVKINITLRDYAGWTKELSDTIKELSSTVRDMNSQHQQVPYDRIRDIERRTKPIHNILRRYQKEFITKRDANSLAGVAVFFISGILILGGVFGRYILTDMKEEIISSSSLNRNLILHNSESIMHNREAIELHDATRDDVLKQLHTHTGAN